MDDYRENEPIPTPTDYDTVKADLKQKPHNPVGWKRILYLAETSGTVKFVHEAYNDLLQQYPNTPSAQIRYIDHFLTDPSTFGEAEKLFKRFLKTSPSVNLWELYLTYVRRVNTERATRDAVRKSYEFALRHVGQDKDSGNIWRDYIQFIRSGMATTTWEEQQKTDALRKVYHSAVQIPLENVIALWQEFESFQRNESRITAKNLISDLLPSHMQARLALCQLTNHTDALYPATHPSPPNRPEIIIPALPTFNASERALVGKWKAYLRWEESDPLKLQVKDKAALLLRIQSAYRKAVTCMRYYAEIWFMAYTWASGVGREMDALWFLRDGLDANPSSFLLNLAYASVQEIRQELIEVHATFDKFLNALQAGLEEAEALVKLSGLSPNTTSQNTLQKKSGASLEGRTHSTNSYFKFQASDAQSTRFPELLERRREYSLAYVVYMGFIRRSDGIKASRAIFKRARMDPWVTWEVYEATALMEYHCSADRFVASRIFEKGLDLFGNEVEYVLKYLIFLTSINDENTARAVFERVIGSFPADQARPLWECWARYEYQYGDLDAAHKLEKRITQVYPADPPIKRFAQRYIYSGLDAIAARDLGFASARKSIAPNTPVSGKAETLQSLASAGLRNTSKSIRRQPVSPDCHELDERGGGSNYGQSHKRVRLFPLVPLRDNKDRGQWGPRRRPPPSTWERDDFYPPPSRDGER